MALATQCPHCYTSFRVANDQLKLHAGMVRCGSCKQTFNGIEHLLAPGATPKSAPNQHQASESSTPAPDDVPNISTDAVSHETSDTKVEYKAKADSTVEVKEPPIPTSTDAQKVVDNADATVDLSTTDTASPTQIDAPQSSKAFGSSTESRVLDEQISDTNSEKSSTSILETMDAEVVEEKSNSDVKIERQSAIESTEVADASNLSVSVETDQMKSVESVANSNINESLSTETVSAPSALSLEFDLEDDDLDVVSSNNIKQSIAKSEIDVDMEANARTGSATANASGHPLSAKTVVQADSNANSHEKSQADSRIKLPTEVKEEENESDKPQSAPETKKSARKPAALTASLDFELSKEERESVDEIAYIHQLELETRAAVLNEATDEWSNHEPKSVQDGFIDSLKELKPILDDIGDFAPTQQASLKSNAKHQTLNDLRVSNRKIDSVADLDVNSDIKEDLGESEVTPAFVLQAERAQRYGKLKRFGLGLGVFLFVLVGVAQAIYFLRSDIAAVAPQLKPQLLSICKTLSCQIKLPAQKSLLEITGSELLIVNEELSMNTLSVQIQNKSGTVQAWPHFDLTLKDRRGKDLLQKAFAPTQYLENKELLNKGMAANSESNHKIFFQLNGLKASDYTVEIFYP